MSHNDAAIAGIIERFQGQELDAHYFAFFECFNRGLYFEAHEVLEEIWLPQRKEANGLFLKGLIQLAGAFVHLQKGRPGPAGALFDLALANLERYGLWHDRLNVARVLDLIHDWRQQLNGGGVNPLQIKPRPEIHLD